MSTGWGVEVARGPLKEDQLLELMGGFDAVICGDDEYSSAVMNKGMPRLKIISKYGIGLDCIDISAATERGIAVAYTPGVNHVTVAEHVFALMLSRVRNLVEEVGHTRAGEWKRLAGGELHGKTLGIIGLGRIGAEVAVRARAFGLAIIAQSREWDPEFVQLAGVRMLDNVEDVLREADIVTLHLPLTPESRQLLNRERLALMKPGAFLINTARGELVDRKALVEALDSGQLAGYCADVLEQEPPPADHPLLRHPCCYITPHIGSRTVESVERQARCAIKNVVEYLVGDQEKTILINPEVLTSGKLI